MKDEKKSVYFDGKKWWHNFEHNCETCESVQQVIWISGIGECQKCGEKFNDESAAQEHWR